MPDCAEVNHLYVAAQARAHGVGSALLLDAETNAVVRRRSSIGLGVGDNNPVAGRLYLSLGYAPCGVRYAVDYEYPDEAGEPVTADEAGDFLTQVVGVVPGGIGPYGSGRG